MIRNSLRSTGVNSETIQLFGLVDWKIQVIGVTEL